MGHEAEAYTFRGYNADDIPFIQSSWAQSYYSSGTGHTQLSVDAFHKYHRPLRDKLLLKPNIAIIVCVSKEDMATILGWVLVEKPTDGSSYLLLHYIYVKASLRGEGIAKELLTRALPIEPVLYTHSTLKARRIIKDNWKANKTTYERWHFCPHLI